MFELIKEQCQTKEGIESLTKEQLYYAWEYVEKGLISLSSELYIILAQECTMNLE